MKVVTADQMREIERRAADVGVLWQVLMDNAGLAIAKEIRKLEGGIAAKWVLILVGPGNNGGDGLVAARHLHDWGAKVYVYLSHRRKPDDENYQRVLQRKIPVTDAAQDAQFAVLEQMLSSANVVIDALLGTGRSRTIEGVLKEILERVNRAREVRKDLCVVAADLPSGMDADSGAIDPVTPQADVTITLGYPKLGAFRFPGASKVGRLIVADIGIPDGLAKDVAVGLITRDLVANLLPKRPLDANKGTFGKVMVVAGSINYVGAAYLACMGATRAGAGLVTLATPKSLQPILATKLTETTYLPLPESEPGVIGPEACGVLRKALPGYNTMLVGCGLGQHPATVDFLRSQLFSALPEPAPRLVLDADALNILSRSPNWHERVMSEAVVTPHPGEMSRLLGVPIGHVQANRVDVAATAAHNWGKTVVLKGAFSVVASPNRVVRISPFANPALASAGTGDVLSGIISGLLAQGLAAADAAVCGVYLHGQAGEKARAEIGESGVLASDFLCMVPTVISDLRCQKLPL